MNHGEGYRDRSRQPTLPPLSNRTLHHPSFLPLYMAAGFASHHTDFNNQTVLPINPAEFFYTDPTLSCGRRIPNIVSELRVFDCFQLDTPPPLMTARPAPPVYHPDPFRSGPHPTRDLGSLALKINTHQLPAQPNLVVLQLTQEEDQAITNLLKLHHQEPTQSDGTQTAPSIDLSPFLHPELIDSTSADVQYPTEAGLRSRLQQGSCWSDAELEAANTLLTRFSLMEKDRIWVQNHNKSAGMLPDPLQYQNQEDSPIVTEARHGSEAFPALITADSVQNDIGYVGVSCARECGEPGWGDFGFVEGRNADDDRESSLSSDSERSSSACGDFSAVRKRMVSDSERDAVRVLLSLGDTRALHAMQ